MNYPLILKHDPQPIESLRGIASVLLAKRLSLLILATLPLVVGGIIDSLGLTPSQAGLVTTVELGSAALVSIITSLNLHRLPRYQATITAIVVVAIAHLLSVSMKHFGLFILFRFICGCAEGVIASTVTSTIATAKNPDRLTAMLLVFGGVTGVAFSTILNMANVKWGLAGIFGVLSLYCWGTLFVIRWIPFVAPTAGASSHPEGRWHSKTLAIPVLAGYFLWTTSEAALWAFAERFGRSIHLDATQIAVVMSSQSVAGLLGSGTCFLIGARFGRTLPLIACLSVAAALIALFGNIQTLSGYAAAILVWQFVESLCIAYVYGILASLDAQGRWLGLLGAALPIGMAVGPFIGGLIVESGGYSILSTVVAACYVVTILLMAPVSVVVPLPAQSIQKA